MRHIKLSSYFIIRLIQFVLLFVFCGLIYLGYYHWSMVFILLMTLAISFIPYTENKDYSHFISTILGITTAISFEFVIIFLKAVAGGGTNLKGIVIYSFIQTSILVLCNLFLDVAVIFQHKHKDSRFLNNVFYVIVIGTSTCIVGIVALFHFDGFNQLSSYLVLIPMLIATSPSYLLLIYYLITKKHLAFTYKISIISLSIYTASIIIFELFLPVYLNIIFN